MLTDPMSFGGRPEDSFDVVVPDLPGYRFSDKPSKAGTLFRVNDLWARLMKDKLGYGRAGIARRGYPKMVPELSRWQLRNLQQVGLRVRALPGES